jgi:outer membrane protein assembly factor BamB
MRRLGTLLSFAVLSFRCMGAEPVAAWRFEHPRVETTNPAWPAVVEGQESWETEAPRALRFGVDAARRSVVTESLATVGLPTQALSVAVWVRMDSVEPWSAMVSAIQDNGSYERGWVLGTEGKGNRFCFGLVGETRKRLTYLSAPSVVSPGAWSFVVGTYDRAIQRLYVDGKLAAESKAQTGPVCYPLSGVVVLGAYQDSNEFHGLQGALGYVAVFNSALSEEAVAALYETSRTRYPEPQYADDPLPGGWPTYAGDSARTGMTTNVLALPLRRAWQYRPRRPPAPAWPPPATHDLFHRRYNLKPRVTFDRAFHVVGNEGRLYLGSSSEDCVVCLDADTGREIWRFACGGPVRLAPSLTADLLVFGSDDGYLYGLDPAAGDLHWRTLAAEERRILPGNGRLVSQRPVRSGVLVDGDKGYFCAGVFPMQGVFQGCVDLATGKVVERKRIAAPAQGYLVRRNGRVFSPTGRDPKGTWVGELGSPARTRPGAGGVSQDYPFAAIGTPSLRIGGGDGRIGVMRAEDGKLQEDLAVDGKIYGLATWDGRLYASSDTGTITCFAPADRSVPSIPPVPRNTPDRLRALGGTPSEATVDACRAIVKEAVESRGYALVVDTHPDRCVALARATEYRVACVAETEKTALAWNQAFGEAGLGGRVTAFACADGRLPFVDYLFVIVLARDAGPVPRDELLRVLRPGGGLAVIGEGQAEVVRRPPVAGAGRWNHCYGEPGNSACSGDRVVTEDLALQWYGLPGPEHMVDRHNRNVAPLYDRGRLFVSGNNYLYAMDAYCGALLWEKAIPESVRAAALKNAGNMAASNGVLYVASGAHCLALNARDGSELRRFTSDPDRDWGGVWAMEGMLLGTSTRPGASRWSLTPTSWGIAYRDAGEVICAEALFAFDLASGERTWSYQPREGVIPNPAIAMDADRVYLVESVNPETRDDVDGRIPLAALFAKGGQLSAIDRRTGRVSWQRAVPVERLRHVIFLSCVDGRVLITGSRTAAGKVEYHLMAYTADTGEPLWEAAHRESWGGGGTHGEQTHHPAVTGGTVYLGTAAYELQTGERRADWTWGRAGHGCGTISVSAGHLFNRGANPQVTRLTDGKRFKINGVSRPGCWINILPAGGLVLIPEASSGCTCNFAVQASMAFRPVGR